MLKDVHKHMTIPECIGTIESLLATVHALREAVQTLNGQRDPLMGAVTFQDIVLKGWIKESEVPKGGGFVRHVPLVTSDYVGPNT